MRASASSPGLFSHRTTTTPGASQRSGGGGGDGLSPPPTQRLWLALPNASKARRRGDGGRGGGAAAVADDTVVFSRQHGPRSEAAAVAAAAAPAPLYPSTSPLRRGAVPSPHQYSTTPHTPRRTCSSTGRIDFDQVTGRQPLLQQPSPSASASAAASADPPVAVHSHRPSPIRPLVKSRHQLSAEQWATLQVQERVLTQLNRQTADSAQRARKVLDLFRSCNPDEFGLISLAGFHRHFGRLFQLTPQESAQLFRIGDGDNRGELDYAAFRDVFVPVDTDTAALQPMTFRPGLARGASSPDNTAHRAARAAPSQHTIVQSMPKNRRTRYLQYKRVAVLLDHHMRDFEACFRKLEPVAVGQQEMLVRTKLSFAELETALRGLGMNMAGLDAEVLREMYGGSAVHGGGAPGSSTRAGWSPSSSLPMPSNPSHSMRTALCPDTTQRIGFSELIKASDRYFALLGQTEADIEEKANYTKLHDMYGRRLGRRAVGTGPAAGGHLSQPGFLAHDDGRLGIASPDAVESIMNRSRHRRTMGKSVSTGALPGMSAAPLLVGATDGSGMAAHSARNQQRQQQLQSHWPYQEPAAGVASMPNSMNTVNWGMTQDGVPPRYDQAFGDDTQKHLWESRWLDKKVPDQKRKLAKKALLGNNALAAQQDHNMFARLGFEANCQESDSWRGAVGRMSYQNAPGYVGGRRAVEHTHAGSVAKFYAQGATAAQGGSKPWATGLNWS